MRKRGVGQHPGYQANKLMGRALQSTAVRRVLSADDELHQMSWSMESLNGLLSMCRAWV
jgi:hypothetical protein